MSLNHQNNIKLQQIYVLDTVYIHKVNKAIKKIFQIDGLIVLNKYYNKIKKSTNK